MNRPCRTPHIAAGGPFVNGPYGEGAGQNQENNKMYKSLANTDRFPHSPEIFECCLV